LRTVADIVLRTDKTLTDRLLLLGGSCGLDGSGPHPAAETIPINGYLPSADDLHRLGQTGKPQLAVAALGVVMLAAAVVTPRWKMPLFHFRRTGTRIHRCADFLARLLEHVTLEPDAVIATGPTRSLGLRRLIGPYKGGYIVVAQGLGTT